MQLGLDLRVPAARCLGSLATLRDLLPSRPTYEELAAALESGVIGPAFDLRTPSSDRALWRIWQPSLNELLLSRGARCLAPAPAALLADLVPALDDVKSSSLERWWGVSPQHIHDLIAAGCLPVRRRAAATAGPGSFHLLSREGVTMFLAGRRAGAGGAERSRATTRDCTHAGGSLRPCSQSRIVATGHSKSATAASG